MKYQNRYATEATALKIRRFLLILEFGRRTAKTVIESVITKMSSQIFGVSKFLKSRD